MVDPRDVLRRAVGELVAREGQAAVAEKVGVSQPTVSRFVQGRTRLTLELVTGLHRAYPHLRGALDRAIYQSRLGGYTNDPAAAAAS